LVAERKGFDWLLHVSIKNSDSEEKNIESHVMSVGKIL